MPFTGQGAYSVADGGNGTIDISAGFISSGALTFSGGSYAIGASFLAGVNLAGISPLSGLIRLADGADLDFSPDAGAPATVYIGVNLNEAVPVGAVAAYGYLDVLGGSTLDVTYTAPAGASGPYAYANFIVGGTAGAFGQIAVDGAGSTLTSSGDGNRVSLGLNGGQGTLVVTSSGRAETLSLLAGAGGGVGQVYLSGGGSEVVVSSATGQYLAPGFSGQSGAAIFGIGGGAGFLGIAGGSKLTVKNVDGETDHPTLRLGVDALSYGYGIVTGSGSELSLIQHGAQGDDFAGGAVVNVGEGGQGVLIADNNARITISGDGARMNIAAGQYVDGVPVVTSEESLVVISDGAKLTIDSRTYGGTEVVDDGVRADGRGSALVIAGGQQTTGLLVVDGAGSNVTLRSNQWVAGDDATGQIIIGNLGTGSLDVLNEATVVARNIELGRTLRDSDGIVAAGSGALTVASGGKVMVSTSSIHSYLGVQVAESEGTIGLVTVTGEGAELASTGGAARIRLGHAGNGTLRVEDGGTVRALLLEAGGTSTGIGEIKVSGAGSRLVISDDDGRFDANTGQAGLMRLGGEAGSSGSLAIKGDGTVTIRNAADDGRDQPSLIVGSKTGSTGIVDVAGSGSVLEIIMTGAANDAFNPISSLYYGPRLRLGERGGLGQVTVRDSGAINLTGENAELWVGEGAAGYVSALSTLTISSGSSVNLTSLGGESAAFAVIGRNAAGSGALTVTGEGSLLSLTSDNIDNRQEDGGIAFGATLTVGRLGEGTLVVEDGGRVTINGNDDAFPGLIIGEGRTSGGVAATGSATVTGAGAEIEILGTNTDGTDETGFGEAGLIAVSLQNGSAGSLTISDGGVVRNAPLNSATLIAASDQAEGVIRLSGSGSHLSAGALLAIGAAVDFTKIDQLGMPEILIDEGGLALLDIGSGSTVSAQQTVVGASGSVEGEGVLISDVNVHGTLGPAGDGLIGALSIDGALTLSATARLEFDISSFASGGSDRLVVSGPVNAEFMAGMLDFAIDPAAFAGPVETITLVETNATVPDVDLTITTEEGAVLHIGNDPGRGIVLTFVGLVLSGTSGADTVIGSSADDRITGSAGADTIDGLAGVDTIDFSASTAPVSINLTKGTASGGDADGDQLSGIEGVVATDGADRIVGDEADNLFTGGLSGDALSGRGGDDELDGGGGADTLYGSDGDDSLYGGAEDDALYGGEGGDLLDGGEGGDLLDAGAGDDSLIGGTGSDTLLAGVGDDVLGGGDGDDLLDGGLGMDSLFGGLGDDTLNGRGGADHLDGGSGNDTLSGGGGADVLIGGAGADFLQGGAGADTFRFLSVADSVSDGRSYDLILDFTTGLDRVDLGAIDAHSAVEGDQAFDFIAGGNFSGVGGELRVVGDAERSVTRIEADVDGDRMADLHIEISGMLDLGEGDFNL
ncbi:M10 family metallopeptidase C-terminal domain-containing protein [Rhodobacteraceae bacterium NNCM2]|nr:M10 family metallopeptidase C-terminal domain-containing protein [Coraliihabitans acroporae]